LRRGPGKGLYSGKNCEPCANGQPGGGLRVKKVAVLQSNYLPWKGYFDIIHDVDLFIFYDEVQYTHRDWRNRNKIYTETGPSWLTVPCGTDRQRRICEVVIKGAQIKSQGFQRYHWRQIRDNYKKAPYFSLYKDFFEHVYLEKEWEYLYELNRYLIVEISRRFLNIKTAFADSRDFGKTGKKHEQMLSLLKSAGAGLYVSGPAAKDYIVAEDYRAAGIELVWKDYSGYPEYPQPHAPFAHNVSIIDLLFNTGSDAPYYIWGWRDK
jgi:hypothetical protein